MEAISLLHYGDCVEEQLASRLSLESVLLNPQMAPLLEMSQSGQLGQLIPEWARLAGERNVQHSAHHFSLDEHTFRVIERTKCAPYFQKLTTYQKWLTILSALLHDIDKNCGPPWLKGYVPVDKLHPVKSAQMSRHIGETLCLSPKTIQRLYTIIHHHQAFGRLFIFFPEEGAPLWALEKIAVKTRSPGVLDCLLALSEGDIRGVQHQDAYFTPRVEEQLAVYGAKVADLILQFRSLMPIMPQELVFQDDLGSLDPDNSACFVVSAGSWQALYDKLAPYFWGGTLSLSYYHQLSQATLQQEGPCCALLRFLPENIAYWGPLPEGATVQALNQVSMDFFYGLLLGHPLKPKQMSSEEAQMLQRFLLLRSDFAVILDRVSQAHQYASWQEAWLTFEQTSFESSDVLLPSEPVLQSLSNALQQAYPRSSFMGVATRPILMGLWNRGGDPSPVPEPWQGVPLFQTL